MTNDQLRNMFTKTLGTISSMRILESQTFGTPDFTNWELLIEVVVDVDEPTMGLRKGQKNFVRGSSLIWWRWEGEGRKWNGSLEDTDSKTGLRGWKIVREHDYMVRLGDDAKGEKLRLFPAGVKK